jgi:hypothetical protein
MNRSPREPLCSFCYRPRSNADWFAYGIGVMICDGCVRAIIASQEGTNGLIDAPATELLSQVPAH